MKVLLVQYAPYVPSLGGGNKSNRMMLEALAERGLSCRAVSLASNVNGIQGRQKLMEELERRAIQPSEGSSGVLSFRLANVAVSAVWDASHLCAELSARIREFQPDWVLVSSEDPGQILLRTTLQES